MKRGFSRLALMCFAASFLVRALSLNNPSPLLVALFYVFASAGIATLGVDTLKNKDLSPAYDFEKHMHLGFFSALASVGFFVDFIFSTIKAFYCASQAGYGFAISLVPLVLESLFAILSSICFVMVSLSYSSSERYDFRQLKLFNLTPLLFFLSKGIVQLSNTELLDDFGVLLHMFTIIAGMVAFYFFAYEIESKDNARPMGVFAFSCFGFLATLYFADAAVRLIFKYIPAYDSSFISSLSLLLIAIFAYFYKENIMVNSKK